MATDSYWFRHSVNHTKDIKFLRLMQIHTHWALGIYWNVIEVLRDQEEYRWSSKEADLQLLCDLIGCKDQPHFLTWFKDCLTLQIFASGHSYFWAPWLNNSLRKWEATKEAGHKSGETRKKMAKIELTSELVPNENGNPLRTNDEHKRRLDKIREEKTRKEISLVGASSPDPIDSISEKTQHWCIRQDTIYFTIDKPVILMPPKQQMLEMIIRGEILQAFDNATTKFTAIHQPGSPAKMYYDQSLQAYGVCKYLYDRLVTKYPPQSFKIIREAKINKQIDSARQLLTIDKRDLNLVKALIDWMYEEDKQQFWIRQCQSTEGLRRNFDKALSTMKDEATPKDDSPSISPIINS